MRARPVCAPSESSPHASAPVGDRSKRHTASRKRSARPRPQVGAAGIPIGATLYPGGNMGRMDSAFFDNKTRLVKDDLVARMHAGDKVSVAASTFSIYAYGAMKKIQETRQQQPLPIQEVR